MLSSSRAIDGVISAGTFNFSDPRARATRAKLLIDRSRTREIDWAGLLEEVCQRVITAERAGKPAIVLRDLPRPTADTLLDVNGFRFPEHHPTILFGDGGTLKSYFCLYLLGSLAERGKRVALFDWELDAAQHRLRLERLHGTDMPDVRYVRCDRPLIYEADRLLAVARADALDFAVYDSAGYACNGRPEDAEQALAYFRAVRQIGLGSLHIAHVNKGEQADQKPFGSSFWHNPARSTWFVKLAATSQDGRVTTIGLMNRKSNLGPQLPAVAYDVAFGQPEQRTTVSQVDAASVDELAASLPLRDRLRTAIQQSGGTPQTIAALAESLGAEKDSVEKTLKRNTKIFQRVIGADGIHKFALAETRRAS